MESTANSRGPADDGTTMRRIWDFSHQIMRGSATQVIPVSGGFAVLHEQFAGSYEHNCLVIDTALPPALLMSEADRVLGAAGLRHRAIEMAVESLDDSWLEQFRSAGYQVHPTVVMALRRQSARQGSTPVERAPHDDLRSVVATGWRRELPQATEESIRQLVDRRTATARACDVTHHVVRQGGGIVARCDLYRTAPIAQVETVETEPEWRNRGYATAVVLDAVDLAHESACDLIFLFAAADDWPQHLYRRLGFARVGGGYTLQRPAAKAPREPARS